MHAICALLSRAIRYRKIPQHKKAEEDGKKPERWVSPWNLALKERGRSEDIFDGNEKNRQGVVIHAR